MLVIIAMWCFGRYPCGKSERWYYSLTWTATFDHSKDTVYFAHCYPYTYSDLQVRRGVWLESVCPRRVWLGPVLHIYMYLYLMISQFDQVFL